MDTAEARLKTIKSPQVMRATVGAMFFLAGLCFASWASRIATIQQKLDLSDAALGGILFALPVGLMLSLPFAGWAIHKVGSRVVLTIALICYALSLTTLGLVNTPLLLIINLIIYGFSSNSVNISVNTQAVATEKMYTKPIMASFHGLWSLAGFCGAGIGTFMIGKGIEPFYHFCLIAVIVIAGVLIAWQFLHADRNKSGENAGPAFVIPDRSLVKLGLIAFCSMICEGAMFDWSVIYFKKIILAHGAWIGAGYTAFMCTMALGRFVADGFAHRFGLKRTLQVSGAFTATGLLIAVIFPHLYTALLGFLLVGIGVSSVVPMVYSAAGKSKTMSPGSAIAAVSTISFVGFLIGPPVIGFLAGAFTLRASFTFIAIMGLSVTALSTKAKL
ncbi:MFS transporter [Mucilaginibacter sp. RS28]|uniref:MFS transporter n=1 Tax=Mucilaginibacter straminoryzae TaxID=2932774 RepID=A0A9X1X1J4_9SPHI|nr:MFS transporter [Mucilaginibacter straminoryzae]MCJ8209333.1 MFS transporter [Mucilaginibacter straminoryzae]